MEISAAAIGYFVVSAVFGLVIYLAKAFVDGLRGGLAELRTNVEKQFDKIADEFDALWSRSHELSGALQSNLVAIEKISGQLELLKRTGKTHLDP